MRSILSIIMLFTLFGDVYPQIAVSYNQKKNTLSLKNDNLYDKTNKFKIGEENGSIKFYVYDNNECEKEVFSSFGASQYEFCSNDTCTIFSVYSFFSHSLGSNSEIICIDEDELPCRPTKNEAGLVFHFKIEKGIFSCTCVFNKNTQLWFIKKLPPLHDILDSPFYYKDFLSEIVVLMMNEGYDNEHIHLFVKDFDTKLQKNKSFIKAINKVGDYPSHYYFMRNIFSILLPVSGKDLSLDKFLLLSKDMEHVFDDVKF